MDVIEVAPGLPAIACALADEDEVRVNTNVQLVLDAGITVSFDRLTVSVDAGCGGRCRTGESEKDRNDQCGEYCFLHVRKPPFFHQ